MHEFGFGLQLDSGDYILGWLGNAKCLKCFGGPGEIRTHDLFHAMEVKSITYSDLHQKHKTYTSEIWTAFGPRVPFRAVWTVVRPHTGDGLVRADFGIRLASRARARL
jgi:hypothetical protein